MPAKKEEKKKTKSSPKKAKVAPKKGVSGKTKKALAYECQVCGVRIVVDKECGCAEEHVFVCCDKPMKKSG